MNAKEEIRNTVVSRANGNIFPELKMYQCFPNKFTFCLQSFDDCPVDKSLVICTVLICSCLPRENYLFRHHPRCSDQLKKSFGDRYAVVHPCPWSKVQMMKKHKDRKGQPWHPAPSQSWSVHPEHQRTKGVPTPVKADHLRERKSVSWSDKLTLAHATNPGKQMAEKNQ